MSMVLTLGATPSPQATDPALTQMISAVALTRSVGIASMGAVQPQSQPQPQPRSQAQPQFQLQPQPKSLAEAAQPQFQLQPQPQSLAEAAQRGMNRRLDVEAMPVAAPTGRATDIRTTANTMRPCALCTFEYEANTAKCPLCDTRRT